jgi:hypothetical protein
MESQHLTSDLLTIPRLEVQRWTHEVSFVVKEWGEGCLRQESPMGKE